MAAPGRHLGTFFGAAAIVVVLDQLTKQWALSTLADGPIDIVGSLRLNLVFNDRAAFSLGFGSTTAIALIGCTLVVVLVVMGVRAEHRRWALGLGIILGGAIGNLTDRALRAGDGFLGGHGRSENSDESDDGYLHGAPHAASTGSGARLGRDASMNPPPNAL